MTEVATKDPYQPSETERAIAEGVRAREKLKPRPKMGTTYSEVDGVLEAKIALDHPDPKGAGSDVFYASIGTHDWDFARLLIAHVAAFSQSSKDETTSRDDKVFRGHMALVQGVEPKDEIEAMLAVQMAAVHSATVRMATDMRNAGTIDRLEFYERSMNRLARTFTTQVEALKKHRSGAQKVVVEHRHYHLHQETADTEEGVGVSEELEHQPHVRRLSERETVLSHLEAHRQPVQGAGCDGVEGVPVPRGKVGGTRRAA
ncbi:MAG TPA: hypothetical protein VGV07_21875 [Devosia sp.]|jgi:hypothetical protein|uniref:hypothetical protein n=1 Tax=Devosia sp. TaxID=1871048 RepID=UPI002DDD72FD|nr:hypothetical protein [Devosia sp.]HEV2517916.1 hypothetical protein [Devosia sp.]